MTVKEYLNSIAQIEMRIISKRRRADAFRCAATSIGSAPLSDMPKAHGHTTSPMEEAICKALDLEAEIKQDEATLQHKKLFLLELIGALDNTDMQSVMIKRHIEKKSWNTITAETYFSRSWAQRLQQRAMAQLDDILSAYTTSAKE